MKQQFLCCMPCTLEMNDQMKWSLKSSCPISSEKKDNNEHQTLTWIFLNILLFREVWLMSTPSPTFGNMPKQGFSDIIILIHIPLTFSLLYSLNYKYQYCPRRKRRRCEEGSPTAPLVTRLSTARRGAGRDRRRWPTSPAGWSTTRSTPVGSSGGPATRSIRTAAAGQSYATH